jgi:hypothetical protein
MQTPGTAFRAPSVSSSAPDGEADLTVPTASVSEMAMATNARAPPDIQ